VRSFFVVILFIASMSNALDQRPATPEHLRLTSGEGHQQLMRTQHVKASTTEALKFMYRSVQEKGHELQIADSPSPCWVRKAATTSATADKLWQTTLAKFDKSKYHGQPFSISGSTIVSAHLLACELHSRTNPPIQRALQIRQSNPEKIEASHLCKVSAGPRGL